MFDDKGRFIIEDYNRKTTFSSFLPGISGIHGIPLWSFYVNRGQAMASFGVENKNNSILEFYPAHQSYQFVRNMGFRTFLKIGDQVYEPFRSDSVKTCMYVGMNELELEETNDQIGLKINITYLTLPDEPLAGLVRKVNVKNISNRPMELEIIDGLPGIIPYGIGLKAMKDMAQTMKAWMQVEDQEKRMPYYRVRYSTGDNAMVSKVEKGNFFLSLSESGDLLPIIVDPEVVFEYDTAFELPLGFQKFSVNGLLKKKQITQNQVPSGFSCLQEALSAGQSVGWNSVIGQVASKNILNEYAKQLLDYSYFDKKYGEAVEKTRELGVYINTKTSSPVFDAYCRQTYVDNVLRGGFPIQLGADSVFYIYSRKHGDIERDYNDFSMLPEYYSQGNGNYRDLCQNRRSDVLFTPYVKDYNIKLFYNLIQLDGYNPLVVRQVTYQLNQFHEVLELVQEDSKISMTEFFKKEFSPGSLYTFLEQHNISIICSKEDFLHRTIQNSTPKFPADFTEGYWMDHWTYNLDLIESYLSVYPEKEEELLYLDKEYTFYESRAVVNPRHKRYVETGLGVRQYHALDEERKNEVSIDVVHTDYGNGSVYQTSLMTKLILLATNKVATLDMMGYGIEMEGGKPGWYDALNGLPGLFGSSVAETFELYRLLLFIQSANNRYHTPVAVPMELYEFMQGLSNTFDHYETDEKAGNSKLWVWNESNLQKEFYRERTVFGIKGEEVVLSFQELEGMLQHWISYVEDGINEICTGTERIPTYFSYSFDRYETEDGHIIPKNLKVVSMPLFLEGYVRYLKLPVSKEIKINLYHNLKKSGLYDSKLKMYKVNESLEKASFEIGRAKAFSPGWLENESIWLHMEYKYLLELLRLKLYQEFFEDLHNACIPFLSEEMYGRSLLENSSFLASSANADEKIHGKGFVARLSGSTAEFLQIWQIMMFGEQPFRLVEGQLRCYFKPSIPEYLVPDGKQVEARFLGKTDISYHFAQRKDIIPGSYQIKIIILEFLNGQVKEIKESWVSGPDAEMLRAGEVKSVVVEME
ncbi:hypothetical protein [Lacrimispora sp.]|uniref:hypothetical protein n=1 Tax=Lacrimispora sp. TaxID=2719234 RepID=UPI0028A8800C|nr:hypothetical protein [Lacrimispora sp.]